MRNGRNLARCASVASLVGFGLVVLSSGVVQAQDWASDECLDCHAYDDVVEIAEENPRPGLVFDAEAFDDSPHAGFECVDCHNGVDDLPHSTVLPNPDPEACAVCHDIDDYLSSAHGLAWAARDEDAARCSDCHGGHDIRYADDHDSKVFPTQLPETCGTCHSDANMARDHNLRVPDPYQRYVHGQHGQALKTSGLLFAATCVDCHGGHDIWSEDNPQSRINELRIHETCGACHVGVDEQYDESIHGQMAHAGEDAPTCSTCHPVHDTPEARGGEFAAAAVAECGTCHADKADTYRGTYHGKVNALGYSDIAACTSCHTPHNILPEDDPRSSVSPENILDTCASCHEGVNESFASYVVHADPLDRENFPLLFTVYVTMLAIIVMTMIVWSAHTILWYRRLRRLHAETGRPYRHPAYKSPLTDPEYVRFTPFNRLLHFMVMTSFLLLVYTGLPLRFPELPWAHSLASVFGGFHGAAWLHRVGAILTFAYVFLHLGYLGYSRWGKGYRGLIFGDDSLTPKLRDVKEAIAHVKWFLDRGPRPDFGRWTYWEKFDYLADAWGVFVFGSTGMLMWYPEFFTRWVPGWFINVAVILHGFEALLALSFIFVIHFFNAHLRPGKFPVDPVFVTGRISVEELREERPREYRQLTGAQRRGKLGGSAADVGIEGYLSKPSTPLQMHYAKVVGYAGLFFGLLAVAVLVVTVVALLLG